MNAAFTERELDLMTVLWDSGPSTAAEVRDSLAEQSVDLAYNTVLTLLRILEGKGYVDHQEEGRAHRYRAVVKRREAGATALTRTLDRLFGGSAEALVAQLVQQRDLSKKDVKRLRRILKEQFELKRSEKRMHPKLEDR